MLPAEKQPVIFVGKLLPQFAHEISGRGLVDHLEHAPGLEHHGRSVNPGAGAFRHPGEEVAEVELLASGGPRSPEMLADLRRQLGGEISRGSSRQPFP